MKLISPLFSFLLLFALSSCEGTQQLLTEQIVGHWVDIKTYAQPGTVNGIPTTFEQKGISYHFKADGGYIVTMEEVWKTVPGPDSTLLIQVGPDGKSLLKEWYGSWALDESTQTMTLNPEDGDLPYYQVEWGGIVSAEPFTWTFTSMNEQQFTVIQKRELPLGTAGTLNDELNRTFERK